MPNFKSKINQDGLSAKVLVGTSTGDLQTSNVTVENINAYSNAPTIPSGNDSTLEFWTGLTLNRYFCSENLLSGQPSDAGFIDIIRNGNNMAIFWISISDGTQYIKTVYGSTVSAWRLVGSQTGLGIPAAKTTGGTSTAYTLTSAEVSGLQDGLTVTVRFHTASGAAPTLNVSGLGAAKIQVVYGTDLPAGFFPANSVVLLQYVTDRWIALSAANSWTYDAIASW